MSGSAEYRECRKCRQMFKVIPDRREHYCSWECKTGHARRSQRAAGIKQPQGFGSQQDRELVASVIGPGMEPESVDLLCAFVELLRVSGFEIRKTESPKETQE
jgi:hypothetical protein